jgi:hypothetical protein
MWRKEHSYYLQPAAKKRGFAAQAAARLSQGA